MWVMVRTNYFSRVVWHIYFSLEVEAFPQRSSLFFDSFGVEGIYYFYYSPAT
jgi:hypothetical protein